MIVFIYWSAEGLVVIHPPSSVHYIKSQCWWCSFLTTLFYSFGKVGQTLHVIRRWLTASGDLFVEDSYLILLLWLLRHIIFFNFFVFRTFFAQIEVCFGRHFFWVLKLSFKVYFGTLFVKTVGLAWLSHRGMVDLVEGVASSISTF